MNKTRPNERRNLHSIRVEQPIFRWRPAIMRFRRNSARSSPVILLLVAVFSVFVIGAASLGDIGDRVDSARTALEQYFETQLLISRERTNWALHKEVLQDRVELVEDEIAGMREKVTDTERGISDLDVRRDELVLEKEQLVAAAASLAETVAVLEARTHALLQRLPDPIRDDVRPLSQQIPTDPADTNLTLGQRFMYLVGVLNMVDKFNRVITVTNEKRLLPSGESIEVTTMYLGIGQGFYVNEAQTIAGVGTCVDEAWVWTQANGSAKQIAKSIAIFNDDELASFVQLPIKINEQGSE